MFHVISRGNKGGPIFPEDRTKSYFVRLLKEGSSRYQVYVYAFCVMSTHYHLLVQINKVNLPEFMHFLGSSYANYLVRNGWFGHVFSGRYSSILVDEEEYMLTVNRYIHLNPVRAGLVKRPQEYRWSSYPLYLGYHDRGRGAVTWLYRDWLAQYFGPGLREAVCQFEGFVESGMEDPACYPHDKVIANAVLGSWGFLARVKSRVRDSGWPQELERPALRTLSLDDLCSVVCDHFGIGDLKSGSYRRDGTFRHACNLLIYMAREFTRSSYEEISLLMDGVTPNSTSHRFTRIKGRIAEDAAFRGRICGDVERIMAYLRVDPKYAKHAIERISAPQRADTRGAVR